MNLPPNFKTSTTPATPNTLPSQSPDAKKYHTHTAKSASTIIAGINAFVLSFFFSFFTISLCESKSFLIDSKPSSNSFMLSSISFLPYSAHFLINAVTLSIIPVLSASEQSKALLIKPFP